MDNLADITGSNATASLANPNITARWVQLVATGTGTVRVGGQSTSSTVGLPIAAPGSLTLPVLSQDSGSTSPYSLREIMAYVPTGATLSVAYEPWN